MAVTDDHIAVVNNILLSIVLLLCGVIASVLSIPYESGILTYIGGGLAIIGLSISLLTYNNT